MPPAAANALLALLDERHLRLLSPFLHPVRLSTRQVLLEPSESMSFIYFLTSGIVSRLGSTSDGRGLELACTGREGVVGAMHALGVHCIPYRLVVQIAGTALRIEADVLRRHALEHEALRRALNGYACVLHTQLAQAGICARFHTSRQRLARWLLTACDRADTTSVEWSHQWVAEMVGGTRSAVSTAAAALRRRRIIDYRRRGIVVRDPERLALEACECVHIVRDAISRFLGTGART